MLYSVKAYKNTGFNPTNIPFDKLILESTDVINLSGIWVLQDKELKTIRIATSYENIMNVDYCLIGTCYYFVMGIKMLNENTCELNLITDYLTTIGIGNMSIISGWCTRRHVTDDTLFNNCIDEDFIPTDNLQLDLGVQIGDNTNESIDVISCTVDLGQFTFEADTYTSPTEQLKVTVPKIPPPAVNTYIEMTLPNTTKEFRLPNTCIYKADDIAVQKKVQALRSLGIEGSITSSYRIPSYFIKEYSGELTISSISSAYKNNITTGLNYKYVTAKNNKVFTGQFQRYQLYSITSGDRVEYKPEDIYSASNPTQPIFCIFADLQPNGKPYCRSTYFRGDSNNVFIECCEGSEWQNYQLPFYGASGQAMNDLKYNRSMVNSLISLGSKVGTTAGSIASNPTTYLTGGASAAVQGVAELLPSIVETSFNQFQATQDYQLAKTVVVPDIKFPLSSGLQNYFNNTFWVSRVRLSVNDTKRFDDYLTQFGYATFEPLTKQCFIGRKYFNYVKVENLSAVWNNQPLNYQLGAIKQLEKGIRIWHTIPNVQAMYDNPIA